MWKTFISKMKTNKGMRYSVSLAIILFLVSAVALLNQEEETSPGNNASTSVSVGYDDFSEKEKNNGENAAKLAEEHYIKEHGALRDTSFFYAELLSKGIYHVVGVDALDGRDVTFVEYDVDLNTKTVKESKTN